ncbi:441_t:CDS:2, partial [Funneliformis geosporum]
SGKICAAKIETSGSTGNIISHLGRKHKIYEYSIPLKATSSLKQIKIDHYTILSDSLSQMTQDQHKYLETLLFEWLILDFQLLYLLKSPSFQNPEEKSDLQMVFYKDAIRDLLEILGPFAELTEKLEVQNINVDLEINDNAFEEYQFEEVNENNEPEAK